MQMEQQNKTSLPSASDGGQQPHKVAMLGTQQQQNPLLAQLTSPQPNSPSLQQAWQNVNGLPQTAKQTLPSSQQMAVGKDDSDSTDHDVKTEQDDGSGGGKGECSMTSSDSVQMNFKTEGKHEHCGKEMKQEDQSDGKMEAHIKSEAAAESVKMENGGDKLDVKSEDVKPNSLDGAEGSTASAATSHDGAAATAAGAHVSTTKPRCKKGESVVGVQLY